MKHVFRLGGAILLATALSLVPFNPPIDFFSTFYTVIGIFFSIGYSIVLGFDFSAIQNVELVSRIRQNIRGVVRSFVAYFFLSTTLFLFSGKFGCREVRIGSVSFSVGMFIIGLFTYFLAFIIFNYSILQKLKDQLSDDIRLRLSEKD